ncbi:hypothetical protein [Enterococcus ureasiticus]|uniref:Uncharacterized protein n=1 Tax=Enterococcus ureasiticus TaxID=903984 RepID=A0A1E5GHL4_9ENTE|nr:hypothetical protein [Enterococcus ureasiticus]OEG12169.1 hypothetical protein BCR21_08000 [Enterococcus ureasiticus]
MKYKAKIISENPDIEEEVRIEIEGIELLCFVEEYKCPIEIGKLYDIELDIVIFDDLEIEKSDLKIKELVQQGDSFSYYIHGIFYPADQIIDAGIDIDLENEDFSDFWYLEKQFVKMRVDRINVNILEESND